MVALCAQVFADSLEAIEFAVDDEVQVAAGMANGWLPLVSPIILSRTCPSALRRSGENQLALPSGPRCAIVASAVASRSDVSHGVASCAAMNPHIGYPPKSRAAFFDYRWIFIARVQAKRGFESWIGRCPH